MNSLNAKIKLDFRSNEPIYVQIARQIEQLVANGELKLGDQLPTVRELATELRINFNTVSRAYRLLDEYGFALTYNHLGSFGRRKIALDVWSGEVSLIHTDHRKTGT